MAPGDALTRIAYADLLAREKRADAAVAEARVAAEADPLSPFASFCLAFVLFMTGRLDATSERKGYRDE